MTSVKFHKMELCNGTMEDKECAKTQNARRQRRRRRLCCARPFSAVILALAIVAISLSQTIFKFRDPAVSLRDVKVQNMSLSLHLLSLSALLSVSVSATVRVDNPNFYDFRYRNSTMQVSYKDARVGVVELRGGAIQSRKTVDLPAVITVRRWKLTLSGLQDLTSGVARLDVDAAIAGQVDLAHIYKRHVTAILKCDVDVFIGNQTVKQHTCKQTIKL